MAAAMAAAVAAAMAAAMDAATFSTGSSLFSAMHKYGWFLLLFVSRTEAKGLGQYAIAL